MQWTTKVLIRLRGCAGWSVPLLFENGISRFSHDMALMVVTAGKHQHQSHSMTKPTKWPMHQAKTRISSDGSLRYLHEETLSSPLPIERTGKTLIRLRRCPGWAESLLGAMGSFCWFCRAGAHLMMSQNLNLGGSKESLRKKHKIPEYSDSLKIAVIILKF